MKKPLLATAAVLGVALSALANTGTISVAESPEKANTLVVTFADHVHETNGLWVVYGATDRGAGTSGWTHAEFLQTVRPEDESVEYALPDGWGDGVKALRFLLSEVPYDYDYTLDFIRSGKSGTKNGTQRLVLNDEGFKFNMAYRVCAKMMVHAKTSSNFAFFTNRDVKSGTPYFLLFAIGGTDWRFDYNDKSGTQVSGVETGVIYNIDASKNGLYVNGAKINTMQGTASTADSVGNFEFFCGNNTAGQAMSNAGAQLNLYDAQIYDGNGNLIVNLVPCVKNGVGGMYDTVRDVFHFSDIDPFDLTYGPSRVESENPYFASAPYRFAAEGPTVFAPATPTEDAADYSNPEGGVQCGPSPLTLSGNNDWGGRFIVSNGILKAAFGQGLGANDSLWMVGNVDASYAGWDGVVTNSLGVGPGQINVIQTANSYLRFAAFDGDLTVNLGGKETPETFATSAELSRLAFNNEYMTLGTLHFLNPLYVSAGIDLILRSRRGDVYLDGGVTGPSDKTGAQISGHGDDRNVKTTIYLMGTNNAYRTFYQYNGGYAFGPGSTNVLGGKIVVDGGRFCLSNAYTRLTGEAMSDSQLTFQSGVSSIIGGETVAGGMVIGKNENQNPTNDYQASVVIDGKVTLKAGVGSGSYGSATIQKSAASRALTIKEGADIQLQNFTFRCRNVFHEGGTLRLNGNQGILKMGMNGTSRYNLQTGARLEAPFAIRATVEECTADYSPTALFVFAGGTFANIANKPNDPIFKEFGEGCQVEVAGKFGGELEVNSDTSITNAIVKTSFHTVYPNDWNYGPEDYLTAPAFKKSGKKTLTLTAPCNTANAYNCATDVADGTLKLAANAEPILPTGGVVRVTGGTLDLGGNAQPLKALLGTAGAVRNGAVTAAEGIYPGGAGAVGSFACDAALAGTLYIDVDADGAGDSLRTTAALDVSNLDLVVSVPDPAPVLPKRLKIVDGPSSGAFRSVTGLPQGWTLRYGGDRVSIGPDRGLTLILK